MNEKLHNQLIRFYPKIFTSDMYFECGNLGSRTVSGQEIATLCDIHRHKRQHVSL